MSIIGGNSRAGAPISYFNQDILSQVRALERILRESPLISESLIRAESLSLPNWYLGAGCIAQTVWNHLCKMEPTAHIRDLDLVYFDSGDLSQDGEARHACAAAALILVVLFVLTRVERMITRKDVFKILSLETQGHAQQLKDVRALLATYNAEIKDLEINKKPGSPNMIVEFELKLVTTAQSDQIIEQALLIEGIEGASWKEM